MHTHSQSNAMQFALVPNQSFWYKQKSQKVCKTLRA